MPESTGTPSSGDRRIVTAQQLREGFAIRWALPGQEPRVKRGKYVVIDELPDGTFLVEEPRTDG